VGERRVPTVVGTFPPKPDSSSEQPPAQPPALVFASGLRSGPGRTYVNGVAGKFAAGDTDPGSFAYVYRVDTGAFTLLPAVGAADVRGAS
jgi:hypothetical protein